MVYIIIHSNSDVLDRCAIEIVNKHLKAAITTLEETSYNPDFYLVQKEEKGNIKIEQIKNLQKKLVYSPFDNTHQFGIIREAHLMTPEAQNALLKTLEECHENTVIILTVNNENSVLQTILSRCIRLYPNEQSLKIETDNFSNTQAFLQKPIYEQINEIDNILKGKKTYEFLDELIHFFREKHTLVLSKNMNGNKEAMILKLLAQAKLRLTRNTNPRITLEYLCFKINHIQGTNKTY